MKERGGGKGREKMGNKEKGEGWSVGTCCIQSGKVHRVVSMLGEELKSWLLLQVLH
jgi:hypothetical protein